MTLSVMLFPCDAGKKSRHDHFTGSYFEKEIVLWGVRWCVAYPISDLHPEEMMRELEVDHATLNR